MVHKSVRGFLTAALLAAAGMATAAPETVRVRILAEQFWPYSYAPGGTGTDAPVGIMVDFAREVLTAADLEHEVELLPWPRLMKYLREEPDQLVLTLIRSREREAIVHWIGPVATVEHALYGVRPAGPSSTLTLEEARGMSVATVVDDVANEYLQGQGFERIINTSGYLKGLEMLLRGRVELYPGNRTLIDYQCSQLAEGCDELELLLPLPDLEQDLYFAMSLGTEPAIVDRVREAYGELVAAGRLEAIRARFLPQP